MTDIRTHCVIVEMFHQLVSPAVNNSTVWCICSCLQLTPPPPPP